MIFVGPEVLRSCAAGNFTLSHSLRYQIIYYFGLTSFHELELALLVFYFSNHSTPSNIFWQSIEVVRSNDHYYVLYLIYCDYHQETTVHPLSTELGR